MKPDWLDDGPAVGGTFEIYAISSLKNFTAQVVQNYYNLNSDQMFDQIEQKRDEDREDGIKQVAMTIKGIDNHDQTDIHYLNPDQMGPFAESPEEIKAWLRSVWYFEFGFEFKTFVPPDFEASETCYLWQLQQRYDFSDRGLLTVSLNVNRDVCEKTQFFMNDKLEWVSLLALILAFFHCLSTVNYFLKLSSQLEKLQKLYDERVESQMN